MTNFVSVDPDLQAEKGMQDSYDGDAVNVTEKKTALNYSYIINPAVAMSGCYKLPQRLKTLDGVVKDVEKTERGYYVIVEFDEDPVEE